MKTSELTLEELVGKRVRSLMDFSGIPTGTIGIVKSVYSDISGGGVMVEWTTTGGTTLQDGFGRDEEFDETEYLELV